MKISILAQGNTQKKLAQKNCYLVK